jgi:hypothetical protein
MIMHVLINLLWRCQLACPYCLLPWIKIDRQALEHDWHEWAAALVRELPAKSVADFAGGEPLLYDGLALLLQELGRHGIFWAITTNALDEAGIEELIQVRPERCALVNVSDHLGNAQADRNIERLRRFFPVVLNRVDHPQAGKRERRLISSMIPYQRYREGTELDGIRRMCNAGMHHWVAEPGGDVFHCNVAMATGRKPIGNLFRGDIVKPEGMYLCDWGCSSCYTSVPGAWQEEMRVI